MFSGNSPREPLHVSSITMRGPQRALREVLWNSGSRQRTKEIGGGSIPRFPSLHNERNVLSNYLPKRSRWRIDNRPVGNIGASKVVGRSKLFAASEYFIDSGVRTGTVVFSFLASLFETMDPWCCNLQYAQWVPSISVILHTQFVVGCQSSLCSVLVIISVWIQSLTLGGVENGPSRSSKSWGKGRLTIG